MAFVVRCDWCDRRLREEDDQAELCVTIYHRRGRSALDAKWAEEVGVTRHFCAAPREDMDEGGRNRAGMVPEPDLHSCYARAIAAMTRIELTDPGMGLEWRLMPVGDRQESTRPTAEAAAAESASILELEISVRAYNALIRAGINTVGKLRAQVPHLHQLPGMGDKSIREIDAALDTFDARIQKQAA